uniref:NADH-ubiquinone oxidoreductase chain 2 n=1 Tax=Chascanopsetta lugubris TaxID=1003706 RepID=A0A1L1WAH9_9PLEU|nr:NADH dehydrogenase subunit 2 [Chascanopsetta lugubris]AID59784.1 NADH dehydrogenase subunit 2 [Chascanopsetta lugubris]
MNPYILSTFLMALGLGTTITFASSHWLLAWLGLEINTLAILPLMARHHHPRSVEASTKYFLAQATAAATLLFASTTNAWLTGHWGICDTIHPLPTTLVVLALCLKMGLAPMHAWLPEVLQGVDLYTGLVLSTWQKLAPFALMLQVQTPSTSTPLLLVGALSILIGGWGGLNQTQLRKLLAYSSIAHLGWMVLIMQFSSGLSLIGLVLYLTMTFPLFIAFKTNNATSINQLAVSWTKSPSLTALTPLLLLSLGGLPPLAGFMPKWLILTELTKQGLVAIAALAAFSALLSLYFYLRLSYAVALTIPPNNISGTLGWRLFLPCTPLPLAFSAALSLTLLPLTPEITALLIT